MEPGASSLERGSIVPIRMQFDYNLDSHSEATFDLYMVDDREPLRGYNIAQVTTSGSGPGTMKIEGTFEVLANEWVRLRLAMSAPASVMKAGGFTCRGELDSASVEYRVHPAPIPGTAVTSPNLTATVNPGCYSVTSPGSRSVDSLEVVEVDPPAGSTLLAGSTVTIRVRVNYHLVSLSDGTISLITSPPISPPVLNVGSRYVTAQGTTVMLQGDILVPDSFGSIGISAVLLPTSTAVQSAGYRCADPLASDNVAGYFVSR
jgi:hypothetical protein